MPALGLIAAFKMLIRSLLIYLTNTTGVFNKRSLPSSVICYFPFLLAFSVPTSFSVTIYRTLRTHIPDLGPIIFYYNFVNITSVWDIWLRKGRDSAWRQNSAGRLGDPYPVDFARRLLCSYCYCESFAFARLLSE